MNDLFIQQTVEDEDEESLQSVEDGEYVGEDEGVVDVVQEEDAKDPGKPQQNHQHHRSFDPRPAAAATPPHSVKATKPKMFSCVLGLVHRHSKYTHI